MTVNFEIRGTLARLLAMENLLVEHKNVDTACFNVETRVLTLPMLQNATDDIYVALILHEISHALYTPNIDWTQDYNIPCSIVNIVEDCRVEKLCKRKYPGSPKSFYKGYKELYDRDFFCIKDENLEEMNLADRVNLYFKIGNFITLKFSDKEQEIVNEITDCESFDDVLEASLRLYEYCKREISEKDTQIDMNGQSSDAMSSAAQFDTVDSSERTDSSETSDQFDEIETPRITSIQQKSGESSKSINQEQAQLSSSSSSSSAGTSSKNKVDVEVKTADQLEKNLRTLSVVNNSIREFVYLEIPKVNLDTVIVKNSTIHQCIDESFNRQQSKNPEIFSYVDEKFFEFKKSAKPEVNYLIKEFECRKAADSYVRAQTSRSGVLNTSKLHAYKYSDDLFKRVTILPEGKNHGLIFILDWSGSMESCLLDTCKQLFNLAWFCKKLSIPFEVYAFTNEWKKYHYDYHARRYIAADLRPHYTKKDNMIYVDDCFSLMNLLTSNVNHKEFERQMLNIWRIVYHKGYSIPTQLGLSGTPLNESIVALHQIIPQFQENNKLQKVHCIILTDGDGANLGYHANIKNEYHEYVGVTYVRPDYSILRDKKLGTTYRMETDATKTMLRHLKDKFPEVSLIGFRIMGGSGVYSFINKYESPETKQYEKLICDWKKYKSFSLLSAGYDTYFGISSNYLSRDSEFLVSEEATSTGIKNAFMKYLKNKKVNKKILREFITLIT